MDTKKDELDVMLDKINSHYAGPRNLLAGKANDPADDNVGGSCASEDEMPTDLNSMTAICEAVDTRRKDDEVIAPGVAALFGETTAPVPAAKYSTWADLPGVGTTEWYWKSWLPKGYLTMLAGKAGDGKSLLALRICGCFIKGLCWPDGTPFTGESGKILWVECESAQALNHERANNFGYPLSSIITPLSDPMADVCLDNPAHLAEITSRAADPEIQLIVIDSLSGGTHRKENDTLIKIVGEWAARLARDLNKAVLLSTHIGKPHEYGSGGTDIDIDSIRGSSAIPQAPRVVWAIYPVDKAHRETMTLKQVKNNLIARFPEPIGMTKTDDRSMISFGAAPKASIDVSDVDTEILAALKELGKSKTVTIASYLNKDRSYIAARLSGLVAKGLVGTEKIDQIPHYWVQTKSTTPDTDSARTQCSEL